MVASEQSPLLCNPRLKVGMLPGRMTAYGPCLVGVSGSGTDTMGGLSCDMGLA